MTPVRKPTRLHLLPAKEASRCIVIARVRAKIWHILDWDLRSGALTGGSWFRNGQFFSLRCDLSWDGRYMVFFASNYARRDSDVAWTGVCEPPRLKTLVHCSNGHSYNGGGIFLDRETLAWNLIHKDLNLEPKGTRTPFRNVLLNAGTGEDLTIAFPRLKRDGGIYDEETKLWRNRPTPDHPELRIRYAGYFSHHQGTHPEGRQGYTFEFSLEGRPDLLTPATEWAAWDAQGDLLWAERGWLHRAHPQDILADRGPFQSLNLSGLEPPEPSLRYRQKLHESEPPYVPGDEA